MKKRQGMKIEGKGKGNEKTKMERGKGMEERKKERTKKKEETARKEGRR